jgi:tetratricopeptide (TPR) repeat protein
MQSGADNIDHEEVSAHAKQPEASRGQAGATHRRRDIVIMLRHAETADSLESALCFAERACPGEIWPLQEAANWAARHHDWPVAVMLAGRLIEAAPHMMEGFRISSRAMRAVGQHDAADDVCLHAAAQFPLELWPLTELAQAALARAAWGQGIAAAARLRHAFPAEEHGYRIGALCLLRTRQFVDAELVLQQAMETFGKCAWAAADYARAARLQTHWHDAIDRWADYRAAFPDHPEGFVEGAIANTSMAQFDAADALLTEAMGRFPNDPRVLEHYARTAQARPDWREADRRWQMACRACPDHPQIALWHAEIQARGIFDGRRNWDEAFRRFADLHIRFPDFAEAYASHISFLCKAKRSDAARSVAARALEKCPANVAVVLADAEIFEATGELEAAAEAYERAAGAFPNAYAALTRLASVLGRLGRQPHSDRVCEQAIARFPTEPDVFRQYAELAMLRHDWVLARDRWCDAARRFPYERRIRMRLHQVQMALVAFEDEDRSEPVAGTVAPLPKQTGQSPLGLTLADLICRFESLGGTRQGCEFGRVQRALGAEPLGLLRWAQMTFESLLECINSDFEGVGTPEQTILGFYEDRHAYTEEPADPEYVTRDARFHMASHTFVRKSHIPFEKMYAQSCRRIVLLRRKLMEDLAAGDKVFVFKLGDRTLTEAELDELHAALRRHGETTLLYVRQAADTQMSGSVDCVKPGLLVGYLDHFSLDDEGQPRTPNIPAWTSICQQAWRMHAARQPAAIRCEEMAE